MNSINFRSMQYPLMYFLFDTKKKIILWCDNPLCDLIIKYDSHDCDSNERPNYAIHFSSFFSETIHFSLDKCELTKTFSNIWSQTKTGVMHYKGNALYRTLAFTSSFSSAQNSFFFFFPKIIEGEYVLLHEVITWSISTEAKIFKPLSYWGLYRVVTFRIPKLI